MAAANLNITADAIEATDVGERKPFPVLQTAANEGTGQFSPDGRWIAYQSDESGVAEIYVRAFPTLGRRLQVSVRGGARPRWRRDGKSCSTSRATPG
jgi:eukaryotic-like serine/threonine-protein kinase